MLGVLLDTSVSRFGQTTRPSGLTVRGPLGSKVTVLGVQAKPERPSTEKWLQEQIKAIPTIGRLAREGRLKLCISPELGLEGIKGTMLGEGALPGDAFSRVQFTDVPSPVDRSKFQQMELSACADKQKLIEFCEWLLTLTPSALKRLSRWQKLSNFEIQNLQNIARLKALCRGLPSVHYPDAFHLWTAEVNKLDCFLVADQKFINVMTQTSTADLTVKPLAPADLLADMGITDREPFPIPPGTWRPLF